MIEPKSNTKVIEPKDFKGALAFKNDIFAGTD